MGIRTSLIALLCALLLAACTRDGFRLTDITGATFARDFELAAADGRRVTLADFRGKVVVVFFGFTQCPDVCPTTLAQLAEATRKLGKDAERVQVLFITVDPERDTPELLAQYVPAFDSRFLGLYGTAEEIARTAREFKVFYQKQPGQSPETYTVDHSAAAYIFDRAGRIRLFARHNQPVDDLVHDLRRLLSS